MWTQRANQKKKTVFCFSWQVRLLVVNYQIPTLDEHKILKNGQLLWFFAHRKQKKKEKEKKSYNKGLLTDVGTDEQQADV